MSSFVSQIEDVIVILGVGGSFLHNEIDEEDVLLALILAQLKVVH